jgi:nicotinate phosphoribosyltransferase
VDAASPKDVMFFPARHDHWLVQTGDGYAAHIAGAIGVSTDAQASWWGSEGMGTVPHGMIAAYGGDTVLAAQKFADYMPEGVRLICLVDFENDSVGTSLRAARALGERLYGVRLDTSSTLVDRSVIPQMGSFNPTGVNPQLTWNVRRALDREGFEHVRIVVSGGFTVEKIRLFEEQGVTPFARCPFPVSLLPFVTCVRFHGKASGNSRAKEPYDVHDDLLGRRYPIRFHARRREAVRARV